MISDQAPRRIPIPHMVTQDGVIAILRGTSGIHLYEACSRLIDAGVRCVELTTNTPEAFETVARLRANWGDRAELGIGTVVSIEQVNDTAAAGGSFVVAPNLDSAVGACAAEQGLGWYPGALTPTEISQAWNAGATAVKVFPAGPVGGPGYLRQVRAPLDLIPMIPTGGVAIDQISDYLRAGATAVGLGGPLIGDVLHTGDLAPMLARAREVMRQVADAKAAR